MFDIHTNIDKKRSFRELKYNDMACKRITDNAVIYGSVYAFEKIDGNYKHINHDIYECFILYLTPDKLRLTMLRRNGIQEHYAAKLIHNKDYSIKFNKKSISTRYTNMFNFDKLIDLFTDDLWECYRDNWITAIINNNYFRID